MKLKSIENDIFTRNVGYGRRASDPFSCVICTRQNYKFLVHFYQACVPLLTQTMFRVKNHVRQWSLQSRGRVEDGSIIND